MLTPKDPGGLHIYHPEGCWSPWQRENKTSPGWWNSLEGKPSLVPTAHWPWRLAGGLRTWRAILLVPARRQRQPNGANAHQK